MKFYVLISCVSLAFAFPEQGTWNLKLNTTSTSAIVSKTLFEDSTVNIDITDLCGSSHDAAKYNVTWILINVECFNYIISKEHINGKTLKDLGCSPTHLNATNLEWAYGTVLIECDSHAYTGNYTIGPVDKDNVIIKPICGGQSVKTNTSTSAAPTTAAGPVAPPPAAVDSSNNGNGSRKRRAVVTETVEKDKETNEASSTKKPATASSKKKPATASSTKKPATASSTKKPATTEKSKAVNPDKPVATTWKDGQYSLWINVVLMNPSKGPEKSDNNYTVKIDIKDNREKFLSAADFPYLYFYLIMTILYVFYGFFWLLMMACYWRDLLRIQYFILLVIILGFIEKVFYYSEYEHVDKSGEISKTMVIVAELVSVAKKTLARALVVVVSVGFGLVKPRLGPTLHKLLAVCLLYFILASVEACLRASKMRQNGDNNSQSDLLATIPLALCETGIIYWVFSSLLQTVRTLRLRRNITKLSLYRHFTNLLIFSILASVAYFIWYLWRVRLADCVTDIREVWLGEGFWPMLFSVVLLVIMILWRPSINNQRYSHSLLLEHEDGEDEEDTLMGTDAFEAKRRTQVNGNSKALAREKRKTREEKVEDDLQWIEDNIPATVADSNVLNDSEEEIMTTRFELSKMD